MDKKQSFGILLTIAITLVITYQNCSQTGESDLFGMNCNSQSCFENPDSLSLKLDESLVPGGVLKISSNPAPGVTNLRLTGECDDGGFQKTLVKAKIYQCTTTGCTTLKVLKTNSCSSDGKFEIASTVSNLTPGTYQLNMEIVGFNSYEQEVYGLNSKAAPIGMKAQQTILPPVLASFTGTNFWAQDKIYSFSSATEKIGLDGYITGFCDYNSTAAAGNTIYLKLAVKGSSTYTGLASTTCKPIVAGSVQANSAYRAKRTGYFQLDSFSFFLSYSGGTFVTCSNTDSNCLNNPFNKMSNRLASFALTQKDLSFNYDTMSVRKVVLRYTGNKLGKGWLVEPLVETLKRIKRSFNFSNTAVSGDLNGTLSGVNDFTQAYRILISSDEFADPLIKTGETRYGFGTRAFIVRWLLGATEDISASTYTANNIYFLGTASTVPYKNIAAGAACSVSANLSDAIKGVVGAQYSSDQGVERITVCLAHKFLSGLWNRQYSDTLKMVHEGVTFVDNNAHCFYRNGGTIPDRDCSELLGFYASASKMKTRHLGAIAFANATDSQLTYFGNGLTQSYINRIMANLLYRSSTGDNEYFSALFINLYPEITDAVLRRSLYPTEYNFTGSTQMFGATRSKQLPDGSYTF